MSVLNRLEQIKESSQIKKPGGPPVPPPDGTEGKQETDPLRHVRVKLLKRAVDRFGKEMQAAAGNGDGWQAFATRIDSLLTEVLEEEKTFLSRVERQRVLGDILNDIFGLGPIEPFVKDPTVTEVMVNGFNSIYIEREGRIEKTEIRFRDDEHVMQIIEKIIFPLGRRIDESSPMVDARLPNGSRVNAIIPPLAIDGPSLTIRKFSEEPFGIDDLTSFGTLSSEMAMFLRAVVEISMNVLVSGGTGTGKTTLLNVLSSFIPKSERIVTIEDAAELKMHQPHVVRLESRPANIEGKGRIGIRELVINSLRMRPDRIIVGEVRGGEALDMLQAMNTGHDGSLTTLHANSPRDALARLETMVLMAGMDLPVRAIREQVAGGINLIIHLKRFRDGTRKIVKITEIAGMEGDIITMQDLFVFDETGMDEKGRVTGRFRPTGIIPRCQPMFKIKGIHVPQDIFRTGGAN